MKAEHEQVLAAVRGAMNEVLANFPENQECYIHDAVDFYLSKVDVGRVDTEELEEMIENEEVAPETVAVLDDGARVLCDLEEGRVWIEE